MKNLIVFIFSCWFIACTNNATPPLLPGRHDFFPVNSFIKGQINEVDSFKLPVRKYSTVNNKIDSVLISQEEFDSLANEFIRPDFNDPSINKFYKETSFADQSISSVTFTYSTQNKDLPLQRMDIIINPDPVLNDQVKSVYLEVITTSGNTFFLKKLYWKTNKYFQIISTKQPLGSPALFSKVKVTWSGDD